MTWLKEGHSPAPSAMPTISSLLNPDPSEDTKKERTVLPSPSISQATLEPTPSRAESTLAGPLLRRGVKLPKDAAIFMQDKVRGEVRYPPCESYDEATLAKVKKYAIYPLGRIGEFHRHIPYNSDKKTFLEKTGRDAFEVFQYTFRVPDDQKDKEYVVMWDYNIGLVRITPFFKCLEYSKTVPSKVMNANDGLKNICHSITGGALAAQGYWMPFDAARAVALTFCHSIRYALVPVFGPDFPDDCISPEDPNFARMRVAKRVIEHCTSQAAEFCAQALAAREGDRSHTEREGSTAYPDRGQTATPTWTPINAGLLAPQFLVMNGGPSNGDASEAYTPTGSEAAGSEAGDAYLPSPHTEAERRFFLPSPSSLLARGLPPRSVPPEEDSRTQEPPPSKRVRLTEKTLREHERSLEPQQLSDNRSPAMSQDEAVSPKTKTHPFSFNADKLFVSDCGPWNVSHQECLGRCPLRKVADAVEHPCDHGLNAARTATADAMVMGDGIRRGTSAGRIWRLPDLSHPSGRVLNRAEVRAVYALVKMKLDSTNSEHSFESELVAPGRAMRGRKRRASH